MNRQRSTKRGASNPRLNPRSQRRRNPTANNQRVLHQAVQQLTRDVASLKRGQPNRRTRRPKPPIGPPTVEQVQKQVKRVEKRSQVTAVKTVATTPSMTSERWDPIGLCLMSEALIAYYAMETDILTEVSPRQLVFYFAYLTLAHFNRYGMLSNPEGLPVSTEKLKYAVPYALAKYLEYHTPYSHNGVSISLAYDFLEKFFDATNNYTGTGIGISQYKDRPVDSFPSHQFFRQTTLSNMGLVGPQMITFPNDEVTEPFEDFVSSEVTISMVSTAINKRGNTVLIGAIPSSAPDSSAYSRQISPGTTQGVVSIDDNYDPELTLIFAPIRPSLGSYNTATRKSYPNPNFQITGDGDGDVNQLLICPPNYQSASVFVFLAQHVPGPYRAGRVRDVFKFCGRKLTSLYPTEQPTNNAAIGEAVQSAHSQLLASKTSEPGQSFDPGSQQLCIEMIVAYSADQYRKNLTEVVHFQCPATAQGTFMIGSEETTVAILQPQCCYVDATWASQQFPTVALLISVKGPVVSGGKLRIPFTSCYGDLSTAGNNPMGPIAWSSQSFVQQPATPTNFTTPMIIRKTNASNVPPKIIWDDSQNPAYLCDSTFMSTWYGYKGAGSLGSGSPLTLLSLYPTAGSAACIQNQFKKWIQTGAFAQTSPLAPVNSKLSGYYPTMTSTYNIGANDASVVNTNIDSDTATQSIVNTVFLAPASIASETPLDHEDAAIVALNTVGELGSVAGSDPASVKRYYAIQATFTATGVPVAPTLATPTPLTGPHVVDIPWSTGKAGLFNTLSQMVSSTQSPFAAHLAEAQAEGDYDIVQLYKRYVAPALRQSMQSVPGRQVPVGRYLEQMRPRTKKVSTKDRFLHVAGGLAKKGGEAAFKFGMKQAEKALTDVISGAFL